jgi:hypothetical protein
MPYENANWPDKGTFLKRTCKAFATGAGVLSVGSSTDVTAFDGARGGQAEGALETLGYEPIRTQWLTPHWFNRSTGACARFTTADGMYSGVSKLSSEDC